MRGVAHVRADIELLRPDGEVIGRAACRGGTADQRGAAHAYAHVAVSAVPGRHGADGVGQHRQVQRRIPCRKWNQAQRNHGRLAGRAIIGAQRDAGRRVGQQVDRGRAVEGTFQRGVRLQLDQVQPELGIGQLGVQARIVERRVAGHAARRRHLAGIEARRHAGLDRQYRVFGAGLGKLAVGDVDGDIGGGAAAERKHGLVFAIEQISRHAVIGGAIIELPVARHQRPVTDAVRGAQLDLRGVVGHDDIAVIDIVRRDRDGALLAGQAAARVRHGVMAEAPGLAQVHVAHDQRDAFGVIGAKLVERAVGGVAGAALAHRHAAVIAQEHAADLRRQHGAGGKGGLGLLHAIDVNAQMVAIVGHQRIEAPADGDMLPGAGRHRIGRRFGNPHGAGAVGDHEAQGAIAAPDQEKIRIRRLRGVDQLGIARAAAGPGRIGLVPERHGARIAHHGGHRQAGIDRRHAGRAGIQGDAGGAADAPRGNGLHAAQHRAVGAIAAGIEHLPFRIVPAGLLHAVFHHRARDVELDGGIIGRKTYLRRVVVGAVGLPAHLPQLGRRTRHVVAILVDEFAVLLQDQLQAVRADRIRTGGPLGHVIPGHHETAVWRRADGGVADIARGAAGAGRVVARRFEPRGRVEIVAVDAHGVIERAVRIRQLLHRAAVAAGGVVIEMHAAIAHHPHGAEGHAGIHEAEADRYLVADGVIEDGRRGAAAGAAAAGEFVGRGVVAQLVVRTGIDPVQGLAGIGIGDGVRRRQAGQGQQAQQRGAAPPD